jgi:DNA-binding Lrp family transcriptional regulator
MTVVAQRAAAEHVRDVDELDMALLDAMHVNPRASFEQLGSALGVSAVTAARRWQRLTGEGRAWVSSTPGPRLALAAAIYEVECSPGCATAVGGTLAALPHVASVYLTAGTFDVVALVMAPGMSALSELLPERLSATPGISRVRSNIVTNWYSEVHWRLGAISTGQELAVRPDDAPRDQASERRTLASCDAWAPHNWRTPSVWRAPSPAG